MYIIIEFTSQYRLLFYPFRSLYYTVYCTIHVLKIIYHCFFPSIKERKNLRKKERLIDREREKERDERKKERLIDREGEKRKRERKRRKKS